LHAARKAKPDEIWIEKIFDTSKHKTKISNIFEQNLATEQTSFSFCRDSVKENRTLTNQSFSHGEKINTSFTDISHIKDQRTSYKPRHSFQIEENKSINTRNREATQRRNRWDSNFEGIYRNRHLSGQRENSRQSLNASRDYLTAKYKDQSPPIRDNSLVLNTEGSVENKENRDSNGDFNTEQADLSQVYNIFKYTMQRNESKRPQSLTRLPEHNPIPKGPSNVGKDETKEELVGKGNNYMFNRIQAKPRKRLLAECFGALKIFYLRKKRIGQKVLTLRYCFL